MKKLLCFFLSFLLVIGTSFNLMAFALDSGFRNPANLGQFNFDGGAIGWSNFSAVTSSNNVSATVLLTSEVSKSHYIRATNFGFTIPSGAVINGIELTVEKSEGNTGSASIVDSLVKLSKNNVYVGENKAKSTPWSTSDEVVIYGGPTDLRGETRTSAEINNTKFGMFFVAARNAGTAEQARVDHIALKVYYTETLPPVPNPSLSQACGLDIAFVVDRSGSIDNDEMTALKNALTSFANAFNGTPTAFSLTTFDTTATILNNFSLTPKQASSAVNGLGGHGVGETNWTDGLAKGFSTFDPRPSKPNLIIFASDGQPTEPGTDADALASAIVQADLIKKSGVRILTIGVSLDADGINKLKMISGPNVDAGGLSADVITSSFSTLAADLAVLAQQLCGGTITVSTYLSDTTTPNGQGTSVTVAGSAQVTDANGQTNAVDVAPGSYGIVQNGAPEGYEFASATCRNQDDQVIGNSVTDGRENIVVDGDDIVSCDIIYSALPVIVCGDGVVNGNDICDDGNDIDNDTCNNSCQPVTHGQCGIKNGQFFYGQDVLDSQSTELCLGGTLSDFEGPAQDGTYTWSCLGAQGGDDVLCGADENRCGDGSLSDAEICDGGVNNGQPNNCNTLCSGITSPTCGNGTLEAGEACDDGDQIDENDCTNACMLPTCGDGIIQANETCDDQDNDATDGCGECQLTTNGSCGELKETTIYDIDAGGDALNEIDAYYLCEQGEVVAQIYDFVNHSRSRACMGQGGSNDTTCTATEQWCGDGVINGQEFCDTGLSNGQPNYCSTTCDAFMPSICGNAAVEIGELCDDGNLANGDGCNDLCMIEQPVIDEDGGDEDQDEENDDQEEQGEEEEGNGDDENQEQQGEEETEGDQTEDTTSDDGGSSSSIDETSSEPTEELLDTGSEDGQPEVENLRPILSVTPLVFMPEDPVVLVLPQELAATGATLLPAGPLANGLRMILMGIIGLGGVGVSSWRAKNKEIL